MSAERMIGALLGAGLGMLTPGRRATRSRRSPAGVFGMNRSTERALASLAAVAASAIATTMRQLPESEPSGQRGSRTGPGSVPTAGHGRPSDRNRTPPQRDAEADALMILRAMIAAARADGMLDLAETQAIAKALDDAGLDAVHRDTVLADLAKPLDVETLARALNDPIMAAQAYAACLAAIGDASEPERRFLDDLARRTGLDASAVAAIEAAVLR